MKISCPACNARYRIPDDRIMGKNRIFKVKCKRCGSTVRVRGMATDGDDGRQTMPFNLKMPEPTPATPQRVWFVGIDGKQVGPLTEQEVTEHIGAGRLGADDLMWRKGFSAWTPVREVAPFQELVTAAAPAAAQPAAAKRRPRRAQTLELSASMIELLVKLDEQTDHGANAGSAVAGTEPPVLPSGGEAEPAPAATAEPAAAPATEPAPEPSPPIADEATAAPPIPETVEEEAQTPPAGEEDAPTRIGMTALPTDDGDDELPPEVPGSAVVAASATPAAQAAAEEAPAAAEASPTAEPAKGRRASKVALPGKAEATAEAADAAATTGRGKRRRKRRKTGRASTTEEASSAAGTAAVGGRIATLSGGAVRSADAAAPAKAAQGAQKPSKGAAAPAKKAAGAAGAADKRAAAGTRPQAGKLPPKKKKKKGGAGLFIGLLAIAAIVAVAADLGKQVISQSGLLERVSPRAVAAAPQEPETAPATPAPGQPAIAPAAAVPEPAATAVDRQPDVTLSEPDADGSDAVDAGSDEPDAGAAGAPDTSGAADAAAALAVQVAELKAPVERKRRDDRPSSDPPKAARVAKVEAAKPTPKVEPPPPAKRKQNDDIDRLLAEAKARQKAESPPPAKKKPEPAPPPEKKKTPQMDDIDRLLAKAKTTPPEEKPEPAAPAGKGKLSKHQVNVVASRARSKIMRCYFTHADVDGAETLKVELRIGPDGHVISARVKGKHAKDQVGSCVSSVVKALRFPRATGASSKHTIRYTVGG